MTTHSPRRKKSWRKIGLFSGVAQPKCCDTTCHCGADENPQHNFTHRGWVSKLIALALSYLLSCCFPVVSALTDSQFTGQADQLVWHVGREFHTRRCVDCHPDPEMLSDPVGCVPRLGRPIFCSRGQQLDRLCSTRRYWALLP